MFPFQPVEQYFVSTFLLDRAFALKVISVDFTEIVPTYRFGAMPLIAHVVFDLQGVVNLLVSFSEKAFVLLSGLLVSVSLFWKAEQIMVVPDSPYVLGLGENVFFVRCSGRLTIIIGIGDITG